MESLKTIIAILFVFVVLPVLSLKLGGGLYKLRRQRLANKHPEKIPGTQEYRRRLQTPQFTELERRLVVSLPESYRRLHENSDLVLATDFYLVPGDAKKFTDAYEILYFFPAQPQVLEEVWDQPEYYLPIACDGVGDVYYLDLRENGGDGAVYILHHDGGDCEKIAGTLAEFLSWQRMSYDDIKKRL